MQLGDRVPCSNGGGTISVATDGLSDGPHQLRVDAIDTGGLVRSDSRTFYVDNSAPAQPIEPSLDGGTTWRSIDDFALRWTDPAQSAAPVVAADVQLCPSGTTDSSKCTNTSNDRTPGTGASTVSVPGQGDWTAKIALRDAAGNENGANAVTVDHLRYDATPPTVAIAPADASDPTWIHVLASDTVSGIAGGDVEVERSGDNVWQTLPTTVTSDGLTATLDDSSLPDGVYSVRAHVVDQAATSAALSPSRAARRPPSPSHSGSRRGSPSAA